MKIGQLTFLAFYLNGALGSGKYDDISIEEVKRRITDGTVLRFLAERLGDDVDLSILSAEDKQEILQEWHDLLSVNESRKMCVERHGLCLLVAYLLEGIQQRVRASR